jgi:hypothetical protein
MPSDQLKHKINLNAEDPPLNNDLNIPLIAGYLRPVTIIWNPGTSHA